jgi:hypothetical protein
LAVGDDFLVGPSFEPLADSEAVLDVERSGHLDHLKRCK